MAVSKEYLDSLDTLRTVVIPRTIVETNPKTFLFCMEKIEYYWKRLKQAYWSIETYTCIWNLASYGAIAYCIALDLPVRTFFDNMQKLHERKNAGYSGVNNPDPWSNFRECVAFGVEPSQGCLVRLSDKYSRMMRLLENENNDLVGESILDTLQDFVAYCLIYLCLEEEIDGISSF